MAECSIYPDGSEMDLNFLTNVGAEPIIIDPWIDWDSSTRPTRDRIAW